MVDVEAVAVVFAITCPPVLVARQRDRHSLDDVAREDGVRGSGRRDPPLVARYQWRVPPTTAPYTILAGDIVKGVSITLTRDEDWWARDRKYYRHRFNVDHIRYTVVRDLAKALARSRTTV